MQFRYTPYSYWYKGNTHLHTTLSDGGKTYAEVEHLYASAGYSFLVATDHFVASHLAQDQASSPLLWIDGVELDGEVDGQTFHVACLGSFEDIDPQAGLIPAMERVQDQNGILILAHPFWSGNTFTDTQRWPFHGVEVYNHVCEWLNGKGDGRAYWNYMLNQAARAGRPGVLAIAADDAHLTGEHPGWNGGWIVVNAQERTTQAILDAIRSGNYYASCGPAFKSLAFDGVAIHFTCSPVQFARLVGPGYYGDRRGSFTGERITGGAFPLPAGWAYCYLEIEDSTGRRAWTNSLFLP
jgi:hypothetical protein